MFDLFSGAGGFAIQLLHAAVTDQAMTLAGIAAIIVALGKFAKDVCAGIDLLRRPPRKRR